MTYEIISIIALLLCLLIIGIEYIFHYRLAEIQDDNIARLDGIRRRLKMRVEGVLFAPTDRCRADEITSLVKEIDGDFELLKVFCAAQEGSSFAGGCLQLARQVAAVGEAHALVWWNLL